MWSLLLVLLVKILIGCVSEWTSRFSVTSFTEVTHAVALCLLPMCHLSPAIPLALFLPLVHSSLGMEELGPQQNQGKRFYREAGFTERSCVCTLPPDQEEAPAWQRQSGPGAERDSCSCLGTGLIGTGSGACWAETVRRGSREIFLVLFGNGKQEQDLIKMYLFINFGGKLTS